MAHPDIMTYIWAGGASMFQSQCISSFGHKICMKMCRARHHNMYTYMTIYTHACARLESGAWPSQYSARIAEETPLGVPMYSAILSLP